MKNVITAPNPLVDHTSFIFQPKQPVTGGLDVQIQIYNLNGIKVRVLEKSYSDPIGITSQNNIVWDGTDSNGKKLTNGLYPFKIIFRGSDGSYSETSQKIMIIR